MTQLRRVVISLSLLFLSCDAYAQLGEYCATDILREQLVARFPMVKERQEQLDNELRR